MRGLPPVPDDVISIRWRFDVHGSRSSSTTYYYVAGAGVLARDELIDLCDAIAFFMLDLFVIVTTEDVQLLDYEATLHGPEYVRIDKSITPNHGGWDGTTFVNCAVGIYWLTNRAGRTGHAITYFPSFPQHWTGDGRTMNSDGYGTVRDNGNAYLEGIYARVVPHGLQCVPVLVSRVDAGAPRAHAIVRPITSALPVKRVCDMGRRLGDAGQIRTL